MTNYNNNNNNNNKVTTKYTQKHNLTITCRFFLGSILLGKLTTYYYDDDHRHQPTC